MVRPLHLGHKGGEAAEVCGDVSKLRELCQSEWGGAPFTMAPLYEFGHLNRGPLLRPSLRQPLGGVTIGRRSAAEGTLHVPRSRPRDPR